YEKMIRAEQRYYDAWADYEQALAIESPEMTSINIEIEQIQQQLAVVEDDLRDAEQKYNDRIAEAWYRVDQAQAEYDYYYYAGYSEDEPEFAEVIKALDAAKDNLYKIENDSYITSLRTQRDYLLNRYDDLNNHRDGMLTFDTAARYKTALDNAESDLYLAQIDYESALNSREYSYQSFNQNVSVVGVNLQEISDNIAIQQEKIKLLAGDEENVITANVSGVIDTIDCTAGDTVNKDALLCTIEVPDMGHTLSFSVTNDQAQRLRIGDTATISNYYWGNSVTATLTTIRTDPKNPQTNKVLTFDLEGDVTSGAEMTISVGQKSANYDIIVPNSAIKSDNNGSFVLAVQVKSSPLGNRYTAKRVSVEVLANDDNNSAVVADLNNGDYVITTSSSPVSSGDMVRIADNQT
ncbi:MAG: HlyD family efflux transporter periplasmic adaptor subunit, partial [Oscillospiraceae bacterium]|nr:HlyD family efflux transporter periplasmic adaptor subunit [Oscillospiraceae bacterium]